MTRPLAPAALLLLLSLSVPAAVRAQGGDQGSTGEVEPTEEGWGDEWFDDAAKKRAAAEEKALLESTGRPAPGPRVVKPPPVAAVPLPAGGKPVQIKYGADGKPIVPKGAPAPEPPPLPGAIDPALQQQAAAELARPIEPPTRSFGELEVAWRARREALLRQDVKEAAAQEARLRDIEQELGVGEIHAFAAAALRESRKLSDVNAADSLARAELAVSFAPSLPAAQLQLTRARFAANLTDVVGFAKPLGAAATATFTEPRYYRPLLMDAFVAVIAALLAAGAVVVTLLCARHARYFTHDFHHLFPRGVSRLQTTLLLVILLSLPLVLRLGPFALGAILVAATWLYLERAERIVAGAWLLLLGVTPLASGFVASNTAWEGTSVEPLYAVERAGDFGPLPGLELLATAQTASPELLYAVARARKRLGDLSGAGALLERALERKPKWSAASVNLGNIRFLQGDLDAAERLYTRAIDTSPGLAAAYFNLSRVHYRRVNFALGQETRGKALELDRTLLDLYASGEKDKRNPRANSYLLDVPLSSDDLAAAAAAPKEAAHIGTQVAARLLGPIPVAAAPVVPGVLLAGLFLLLLASDRLRPGHGCTKCGRPVCIRCDPETAGGNLCGQCVNVFARKAVVDPVAKVQKEIAVRRYASRRAAALKVLSFVLASQVLGGRVLKGAAFLFAAALLAILVTQREGIVRPVFDGFPDPWKLALLIPAVVLLYALAVRDGLKGDA